jgi:hypothetical protein
MGRPKKTDRDAVKRKTLTLKLSQPERDQLEQLLQARAAELHKLTGQHIPVSISGYLRWLMDRDAEARGLAPVTTEPPATEPSAGPTASPSKARRRARAPR